MENNLQKNIRLKNRILSRKLSDHTCKNYIPYLSKKKYLYIKTIRKVSVSNDNYILKIIDTFTIKNF